MVFTKRLREGVRRGRIRCSVRVWTHPHVKAGGRYPMDDGHIVVDSILPIRLKDITNDLARESGFLNVKDLLETAKHGRKKNAYLIRFHYLPAGAWDVGCTESPPTPRARASSKMPKKPIAFDTVREIGLELADVEEGTAYGSPALKVKGKMFACLAVHSSAEPNSLVVRIPFDERDDLIAEDPATYYLTDHYVDYPCVVVRLRRIHRDALRDLLRMGWQFVSSTTPRARKRGRK